jgi:hypothetical protein
LLVSFNDYSSVRAWELDDPVGALCRRIAFLALNLESPTNQDYDEFSRALVSTEWVIEWMRDVPCVLFVDELNLLNMRGQIAADFAHFVKSNFLTQAGRFFVFSSHVVPASPMLKDFVQSMNERPVVLRELPLIWSLRDGANLGWDALNEREALFRGRVPALIAMRQQELEGHSELFSKRAEAIRSIHVLWNDAAAVEMLRSFINGNPECVFAQLLQLMNAQRDAISWIPRHMVHVVKDCASSFRVEKGLSAAVATIAELLADVERGKIGSGDGWETLFVVALLIRLVARLDDDILHIGELERLNCSVSFNKPFDGMFEKAKSVKDLIAGMVMPQSVPHVAVYYPSFAAFQTYDVIVAVYNAARVRTLRGYQLKEGKALPDRSADPLCAHSVVVRGQAARPDSDTRGWELPSDAKIDEFVGVTGRALAPKAWREMTKGREAAKKGTKRK